MYTIYKYIHGKTDPGAKNRLLPRFDAVDTHTHTVDHGDVDLGEVFSRDELTKQPALVG